MAMITGHCALNKFEYTCKRAEDPYCRRCKKMEETPLHILAECETLDSKRQSTFRKSMLLQADIKQINIITASKFLKNACQLTT